MTVRRTLAATAALAAAAATVLVAPTSAQAADSVICGVRSDRLLHCQNFAPQPLRSIPQITDSWQVDTLRTTYSWFLCWGEGELHAGGNHTWYQTVGDDRGATGWVPAAVVRTTAAFDSNPSYYGMRAC